MQTAQDSRRNMTRTRENAIAKGLGWFSIGLGLAELAAPQAVSKMIGMRGAHNGKRNVMRAYGLREIAAGVGILTQQRPGPWLWARVAGDALDIASLGAAFTERGAKKGRLAFATASVLGVAALDYACAQTLSPAPSGPAHFTRTIIIDRPAREIYDYWRNLSNLPRFMSFVEAVEPRGERESRWRVRLPGGQRMEWEAAITDDRPGELIGWRTGTETSGTSSPWMHTGAVRFERAPGDRGTLVRVDVQLPPSMPAAAIGSALGIPEMMIARNLRSLKQILETGEVVESDSSITPGMHAARPPEHAPELVEAR